MSPLMSCGAIDKSIMAELFSMGGRTNAGLAEGRAGNTWLNSGLKQKPF